MQINKISYITPSISVPPQNIHRDRLCQSSNMSLGEKLKSIFNKFIAWVQSFCSCGKTALPQISTPSASVVPQRPLPIAQPLPPAEPAAPPIRQPLQNLPLQPAEPPAPPIRQPLQNPPQVVEPLQPVVHPANPIRLNMSRLGATRPYNDYDDRNAGVINRARKGWIERNIVAPVQERMQGRLQGRQRVILENHFHERNLLDVQNQINGALWGQALGDGIGLLTEFQSRADAARMINGRPLEFALKNDPAFVNGPGHGWRGNFTGNAWTDDTDQAMSLIEAEFIHDENTEPSDRSFAERLLAWSHSQRGLQVRIGDVVQDRFDHRELDLGNTVRLVLNRNEFQQNPQLAAYEVWTQQNRNGAANGALMRNSPVALMSPGSLKTALDRSIRFALATHADPRCIASCTAHTTAIFLAINGCDNFDEILEASESVGKAYLELFMRSTREELDADQLALMEGFKNEFSRYMRAQNWNDLNLQEGSGYTFKSLGAAFLSLKLATQYEREVNEGRRQLPDHYSPARLVIEELVAQGGDADTNGAISGSLLGAYFGFENTFPESWVNGLRANDRRILVAALDKIRQIDEREV